MLYGKKAVYENGKGISDFERDLRSALWIVEEDERLEAEKKAKAQRKKDENSR